LSKVLYQQSTADAAGQRGNAPEAAGTGSSKGPDDTIDAEFEVKG
jgi:hypothetical protein